MESRLPPFKLRQLGEPLGDMESGRIRAFIREEIRKQRRSGAFNGSATFPYPFAKLWCRSCHEATSTRCPVCARPECAECVESHRERWHKEDS